MKLFLSISLLLCFSLSAATYYVDFDGGSDSSNGTTTGAAWKHSPDDANATGTADSVTLAAGDTVIFKGGVAYRGTLTVVASGNDGSPITYDGNSAGTWGTGKAIIDGSETVSTSWTQCTSSADAGGNANFANIYWTTVPAGVADGWNQVIMDGTTQCHTAQDPNPPDRFLFDVVTDWRLMSPSEVDTTSITDTDYFTQASSSYWDEAWVGVWKSGNEMGWRRILTFTPATDTITFSTLTPYEDRDSYFSVFNHPALIDQAGETAVNISANRLYVWPPDSGNMSGHTWSIGTRGHAILGSSRRNITVKNFIFLGLFSTVDQAGQCAVTNFTPSAYDGTVGRNNIFSDNEIYFVKSMDRDRLIYLPGGNNVQIKDNIIRDSFGAGTYSGGDNLLMTRNYVSRITGTGLYMVGATNSELSYNTVLDLKGTHANGISVYTGADGVEISHNIVRNCQSLMTFEASANLTFINNLVDANGEDQRINGWSGLTGTIAFYNNSFVNNSVDRILNFVTPTGSATFILKNNIIDGGGRLDAAGTKSNNIYTGLNTWQTGPLWTLQAGESIKTDAELFTTPGSVFTLKAGSPGIVAGTDLSAYFTTDVTGATRTGWDIGAYDYVDYDASSRAKTRSKQVQMLIR